MEQKTKKIGQKPKKMIKKKVELLEQKRNPYDKDQVLKVIDILKSENPHAQEVAKEVDFSARQIKLIRYIIKNGIQEDIDLLLECKYYISRIAMLVKQRKKLSKKKGV